ncbi:Uncharacterized protein Zm00014a_024247 [Zea mays]|uniref:Uncharacterized protein n=1 Tax=Zea mays TaxID=4577 RepID=A0A3L6DQF2_MAIZE|nr:Uncharacterized protein Zm00014a_024247 [Zea mays]
MATRAAARFLQRRFLSSGGKVLSEEEKAAENVYIKCGSRKKYRAGDGGTSTTLFEKKSLMKVEQEKLEKLARKGPSSGEQPSSTTGSAASDVKADAGPTESASASVSTDKNKNYAVLAGAVAALGGLGWYLLLKPKKSEEVVD